MSTDTPRRKTEAELIAADPSNLSAEELGRRIQLAQLRKAEREVELVEAENLKNEDVKEEQKRKKQVRKEVIEQAERNEQNLKGYCNHKTGGEDKAGMFKGDGTKYGHSVGEVVLPNGVRYRLCGRCQKEWFPTSYLIYLGKIDRKDKAAREKNTREYIEVMSWTTVNKPSESVLLRIPKWERFQIQLADEDAADAKK
jgi:hypothetical protein